MTDPTKRPSPSAKQTIDDQIDTTTGKLKLRAVFANKTTRFSLIFFVNARLLVKTLNDVTLIPTSAIQQNRRLPMSTSSRMAWLICATLSRAWPTREVRWWKASTRVMWSLTAVLKSCRTIRRLSSQRRRLRSIHPRAMRRDHFRISRHRNVSIKGSARFGQAVSGPSVLLCRKQFTMADCAALR